MHHFPTTDGRALILSRYTNPEPDHKILLEQLNLTLPAQPPPNPRRIRDSTSRKIAGARQRAALCGNT
jgi:hypothetical protein